LQERPPDLPQSQAEPHLQAEPQLQAGAQRHGLHLHELVIENLHSLGLLEHPT
jgi:hypothetical protein